MKENLFHLSSSVARFCVSHYNVLKLLYNCFKKQEFVVEAVKLCELCDVADIWC